MPKNNQNKELARLIAEAESDKLKELKRTNERLLKQIDKLKDKKADMIEAVYQAADENKTPSVYWLTEESNKTARKLYDRIAKLSPFVVYER